MQEFALTYRRALKEYLNAPGEEALKETYELGRWAITKQLGALDIVWAHQQALASCIDQAATAETLASVVKTSTTFLLESLAAYEMTHRGFLEALVKLSQDALELTKANQALEAQVRERREAEASLRKREVQLAEAQDVARIGSWDWDIASNCLTWTDELYRLFRIEQEGTPLTHERYLEHVHPDDRAMIDETVRRSADTREPFELDHRILLPDGTVGWIHSIGRVVVDAGGRAVRMVGTAQDITERKRIDDALRRNEELFRSLIENSSDIVTILNADGTIRYESPSGERILGHSGHELTGRTVFDFLHPEDAPELVENFRSFLSRPGLVAAWVYRFRHRDGTWRILESIAKNLMEVSGITGILVTSRDITEKVRLQEGLHEAARQRAEEATRFAGRVQRAQEEERQRIARELHDDLCQRLTALRLQVNLLEENGSSAGPARRKGLRSVKHELDRVITDVRRLSANLRPAALDLFGLETALRTLCEEVQKTHGLPVRFRADERSGGGKEDGDAEIALYRIAQEALHNAARHASASEISLTLSHRNGRVVLLVRDDGKGFNPVPDRPHPTSLEGYGLTSMRERAELLGGSFQVDSAPLGGTTVLVELPVALA